MLLPKKNESGIVASESVRHIMRRFIALNDNIQNRHIMMRLPAFFNYTEERVDSGYEMIQDFMLSWLLRCAHETYGEGDELIHGHGKSLLYALLFGRNDADGRFDVNVPELSPFKVHGMRTRRQWKGIDLLVDVDVSIGGQQKKFCLNIENKWYTLVRESQLPYYTACVRDHYDLQDREVVNVVVFCDDEIIKDHPAQLELCRANGYQMTSMCQLGLLCGIYEAGHTGNYLYDEYWFDSQRGEAPNAIRRSSKFLEDDRF
jgi:hypothetical protein